VVEPSSRFEQIKIPLHEAVHGVGAVSAVLGIPRWWPTGSRVGAVLAHEVGRDLSDPMIEHLCRELTARRVLTLRFNFPFAEAGKQRPDPMLVLRRCYRMAVGTLARDPTAAPAHIFLGGMGLGARVAAEVAGERARVDGLFFLGYPLHPQGKPEKAEADALYRVVSPMLFVQGSRDRRCDLDVLRRTLARVGAPTALHVCQDADKLFSVFKKSGRSDAEVRDEVLGVIDGWILKILAA
jgi:predicted alpha/beta-hydrolase family hydrolase